ncbi:MAG: hypothetical protein KBA81_06870 [Rhabdochlamydiaceae bacterium]|nr:hypothetical protein [Rhabdochlamydiaceae bacterium]
MSNKTKRIKPKLKRKRITTEVEKDVFKFLDKMRLKYKDNTGYVEWLINTFIFEYRQGIK